MRNWPLLKYVNEEDGRYVLREIHEGICGSHIGSRALVTKTLRYRHYWLTMKEDSMNLVKACIKCQIHANEHHISMSEYYNFGTLIPFVQCGIDFLGPFPKATGGKNHLVVVIDHFTRWIEVKALATITARKVKDFFYEDVICRFGILKILDSNNGK